MKLEWIILAEGFGTASNGAITAIGVNQGVIITPSLPVTTKRGIMAHFTEPPTELAEGDTDVTLTVSGPGGAPILTQTAPVKFNPVPQWPGLPASVDIFLEIPIRAIEYGTYEIAISLKAPESDLVTGKVAFHVQRPPAVAGEK